ncbi:hypothetical protein DNTS_033481, partial [Danionella cerebrum]
KIVRGFPPEFQTKRSFIQRRIASTVKETDITAEKIDYKGEKVLVHYRQWSHRHDEWFDWDSPYLRAVERVQLRREGRPDHDLNPGFQVNEKVLASWSDCRFYPAKVLAVNKDASYAVKFYDGVVQTVKGIHVKPFTREKRKGLMNKPGEMPLVKKPESSINEPIKNEKQEVKVSDSDGEKAEQMICCVTETSKEETILEELEQHNYSKPRGTKAPRLEKKEEEALVKIEDSELIDSTENCSGGLGSMEEPEVQEGKRVEVKTEYPPLHRMAQRQQIRRKRNLAAKRWSSQKRKPGPEKSDSPGFKPAPLHLNQPTNGMGKAQDASQSESSRPIICKVSRNQLPPVLSLNLDHCSFKCSTPGCSKYFRKAKLLHYHMKYYHGEDQVINSDQTWGTHSQKSSVTSNESPHVTVKRCSLVSRGIRDLRLDSLKDNTRDNLLLESIQRHSKKDRRGRFMSLDGLESRDGLKKKPSRCFPSLKLIERKMSRKTTSDEDSISDCSSDSCGWSEDEMEEDLNVMTSPLSCSSLASSCKGSEETIRCVCEAEEEDNFMLQCEECLHWQHGSCMGLLEGNVPDQYSCFVCRDSSGQIRGQRQSLRHWYESSWLSKGHIYGLSFLENYSHQNSRKMTSTHQLLGDVQHVGEVLYGLQLKISLLQSQTHPDLGLWRKEWKPTERSRIKSMAIPNAKTISSSVCFKVFHHGEHLSPSFQDYISSEHCYQKPQTLCKVLEPRRVLLEDGGRNHEHEYNGASLNPSCAQLFNQNKDFTEECETGDNGAGIKGGAPQQWRINLLDHIETLQEEVIQRMDFIERELDVLENWLDCTGELEPPEPLERLPELKHSIKQLLNKLEILQQIARTCTT